MNVILQSIVGSKLYGLDHAESDTDLKGIYLPDLRDCILGKVENSIVKDTKGVDKSESIDTQYFSLQHFVRLMAKGEVTCFDLLHSMSRPEMVLVRSPLAEEMYRERRRFYSKQLKGFLGFVLSQTRKYSDRGLRYGAVNEVCDVLRGVNPNMRLSELVKLLPVGAFTAFEGGRHETYYAVCGKKVPLSVRVSYALEVFDGYKRLYGDRSKSATDGYDLKAISHAMRCLDEVEQLLDEGDITFPLKNARKIFEVKMGIAEVSDDIFTEIEKKVLEISEKIDKSDLPDEVDLEYWEGFIVSETERQTLKRSRSNAW